MARAELKTTLAQFRELVAEMRAQGVASWAGSPLGDLILGQAPPPKAPKTDPDPKADRRAYYQDVLGRPVTDGELEKLP